MCCDQQQEGEKRVLCPGCLRNLEVCRHLCVFFQTCPRVVVNYVGRGFMFKSCITVVIEDLLLLL